MGDKRIKTIDKRKEWGEGDLYEGEVDERDRPHGEGKLIHTSYYSAGNYTYEGHYRKGKKDGYGVLEQSGSRYEGEWKNNLRDGYGTQVYSFGGRYVGHWKEDKYHGEGTLTEKDGTVYEGELFDMGAITGCGKVTYPNGDVYEGQAKFNKREGHGRIVYKDGTVYEGSWRDDHPFDIDIIMGMAEFVPEKLETFGVVKSDWIKEYQDFDVREGYSVAGFITDGVVHGFMWMRDWDNGPGSIDQYSCGLRDEYKSYYIVFSGIHYQPQRPRNGLEEYEYKMLGLIERDEDGRIVFCGVHKDGMRHGLGSEFSYVDGRIDEVQGLWQNGVLTHKRENDKLVPVQ